MNKYERARNLRYKRPALASTGYDNMINEIYEINDACGEVHWYFEDDGDNIIAAMEGDEDEAFEFKMAFADLEAKCDILMEEVRDNHSEIRDYYDDCTVGLIGNRYKTVGYDGMEEDYCGLTQYEQELAYTEAGKRVCRLTKAEMLSTIGQCVGILLAYYDLRQTYDYLKATMDILRGENMSVLKVVKEIEEAYERQCENGWRDDKEFKRLCNTLPERAWIE